MQKMVWAKVKAQIYPDWRVWTSALHFKLRPEGHQGKNEPGGTSLVVQWLRLCTLNAQGPDSIPGQETRSYVPQLRVHMLQLKILHDKTKTDDPKYHNQDQVQPNKYFKKSSDEEHYQKPTANIIYG